MVGRCPGEAGRPTSRKGGPAALLLVACLLSGGSQGGNYRQFGNGVCMELLAMTLCLAIASRQLSYAGAVRGVLLATVVGAVAAGEWQNLAPLGGLFGASAALVGWVIVEEREARRALH